MADEWADGLAGLPADRSESGPPRGCSWPVIYEFSGKRCILMDGHAGYHRVGEPLVGSSAWDDPWWRDFAAAHPENSWVRRQAEWTAIGAATFVEQMATWGEEPDD